jgi:hypothetical protein
MSPLPGFASQSSIPTPLPSAELSPRPGGCAAPALADCRTAELATFKERTRMRSLHQPTGRPCSVRLRQPGTPRGRVSQWDRAGHRGERTSSCPPDVPLMGLVSSHNAARTFARHIFVAVRQPTPTRSRKQDEHDVCDGTMTSPGSGVDTQTASFVPPFLPPYQFACDQCRQRIGRRRVMVCGGGCA